MGDRRTTTAGLYVETADPQARRVTTAGLYVEVRVPPQQRRTTTAALMVEVQPAAAAEETYSYGFVT